MNYLKTILILSSLFFIACNSNQKAEETPPPLYPQPIMVEANPKEGYKVNVVTGDTIHPIILESGDTLITGVPIPATGKVINPDSLDQPQVFQAPSDDQLVKINAKTNVYKIPDELTVIPVNKDSLTIIWLEEISEKDTAHYIVNTNGDTIKTGVPIPVKGKVVPTTQPQPISALLPRFRDNAINNVQYLDVDQGMSSSYVMSILQDDKGNLWFGTNGGGVSMYNGESFAHYTEKEGLSNGIVLSMVEDNKGNLWFGTNGGGVSMYNGESFIHFTEKEGLSDNHVRLILEDSKGNLWFGTNGGGISIYNGKSFTHFTKKEGLSNNYVLSIVEDNNGNFWIGTAGGGVSMYNGESFTHFTEEEGLINNHVRSIIQDNKGNLWFGSLGGGVNMYNGESFTHFTEKEGLSNNYVLSMVEDNMGNLCFGTFGGGVSIYNGESFTHFTEKEGLTNNYVLSTVEDNKGNLWIGTNGGGVNMYNGESFTHFTEKEGLSNNNVRSILEDNKGNLWFGTYGGGLSMYNGESFTHFTEKEGLIYNYVYTMLEDINGNLWIGTSHGGVSMYNGESFTHFTEKEGLSSNVLLSMLEDNKGNLWFGTAGGGVSMYNGQSFTHFTEKEGLSSNSVSSMIEDKNGNLWIGTAGGGLSMYNGESFTHFTEKEGLCNNFVQSIFEDNRGNLCFGTYGGGVSIYNGKSFTHITEKEGLSNNYVRSISEDNEGNLWASTERGLTKIAHSSGDFSNTKYGPKNEKITVQIFDKNDGLKGTKFFTNSVCLDSKNRMWWGSGKSLTMLDLNKHSINPNPPAVYLKQLDINEQFIDYRNITDSLSNEIEFNGVEQFENYPINLELSYDKNHLTFHFVGIDWSAPHKIQYSYLMEGLNTSWSHPSDEAKADYRNLPYGTYTFKVRAIGESGEWSEAFEYTFSILPPWWHTWWARTIYGILVILFIVLLIRWQTAKLKKRQEELETEVEKATLEIREQKNEIEIAHKETKAQKEAIEKQKEEIEEAHKEITDSINYAERIQRSFLATKESLDNYLKDYFVLFRPKEAVSGDFYWAAELNNGNFAWSVADSTGHGVPGAIMSLLNISSLEKSIETETSPEKILYKTREIIINRLKKDGSPEGGKDGMDCNLLVINKERTNLTFASANNPVVIIRNGELIEFKGDKIPVGKHDRDTESFTLQTLQLQKGDVIYALTDGFPDQFGGDRGKKYMIKNLKEKFLEIANLPMREQEQILIQEFEAWKSGHEQIDDVCIIGVRV